MFGELSVERLLHKTRGAVGRSDSPCRDSRSVSGPMEDICIVFKILALVPAVATVV